ncbi:hypothetical protein CsSME_00034180 [Camellia sinensis var. sinensis]
MSLSNSPGFFSRHMLSNRNNDGMEEPHCFEGARIIPFDKLNNLQNSLQHLSCGNYFRDYFFIAGADYYFGYITGSSSISLEVPVMRGEDDYVLGFIVEVVYYRTGDEESCSMELDDYPYVIITDKINGIDFTYTPTFFGIPKSYVDYVWGSYIIVEEYFGYRIKGGEQFEISFVMSSRFKMKKCASDLFVKSNRGAHIYGSGLSDYWRLETEALLCAEE